MSAPKGSILVTGASGGLGSAMVARLVSSPEWRAFHGLYAVRDATQPMPALDPILEQASASPPHRHDKISLDLSRLDDVRDVAAALNRRVAAGDLPPIRAIVLNAGYQPFRSQTWTDEGLETAFAANYLGHWLLTLMLLQSMDWEHGRIVWVSSWSHNPRDHITWLNPAYNDAKYKEIISGHDLEPIAKGTWSPLEGDTSGWISGYRRYGASKLCGIVMINELQRRLDGDPALANISVLAVDPGAMTTGINRRSDSLIVKAFFNHLLPAIVPLLVRLFPNGTFRTKEKSAGDVLAAALDCGPPPLTERPKSLYLNGSKMGEYNPEARDPKKAAMVWKESVRYAKLKEEDSILKDWE